MPPSDTPSPQPTASAAIIAARGSPRMAGIAQTPPHTASPRTGGNAQTPPATASPRTGGVAQTPPHTASAVIVAAGGSARMGGIDKTFAPLLGAPLIAHTVERFESHPAIDEIALVLPADAIPRGEELAAARQWRKVTRICPGGARRQDSVYRGLLTLSPCQLALIHDGARPCLDAAIIDRGIQAAAQHGAAIAGMPVKDTIKQVSPDDLLIQNTPPRAQLWAAQTPQIFPYQQLLKAHQQCPNDVTDDAAMLETLGHPAIMFQGSYENIKVTTPNDLTIAETYLRQILQPITPTRDGL